MKTFKQFVAEARVQHATYYDALAASKAMQEDSPSNKMKLHFAKHHMVVRKAQPIKGGHRFELIRHFGDDKRRSKEEVQSDVDDAIASSPHSAKHHSYRMVGSETTPNHIHQVDVHY